MKQTINEDKVNELYELDGDGEVLKELLNLFLPGTENKLHRLENLSKSPVAADIKSIAHEMRSSCANVGAEKLSDLAFQLEYIDADSGYQQNASDIIQQMQKEFMLVKEILSRHL